MVDMSATQSREIHKIVLPIILKTYGRTNMAKELANHLSEKIADNIPSQRLHGIILRACWDWMPGGSTANVAANKIIAALDKKGLL
jgi:hypothetical protein